MTTAPGRLSEGDAMAVVPDDPAASLQGLHLIEAIAARLQIAVCIVDRSGRVRHAWGAGHAGLQPSDLDGRYLLQATGTLALLAPVTRQALAGEVVPLTPVDASGEPWNVQAVPLGDGAVVITSTGGQWARADQAERELSEHRRALLVQLFEVEEAARQRVAAAVHDDTMQLLTAVGVRLHMLRRQLTDDSTADARRELAQVDAAVDDAVGRLRGVLFDLEPTALIPRGIEAALRDLVAARVDESVGCTLDIDLAEEPPEIIARGIYRVAQEAIANVVRHAVASRVELSLRSARDGYELSVHDDGVGMPERRSNPGHLGITTMYQRVRALGGSITVDRAPAGGTLVRAWMPGMQGLDRLDALTLRQTLIEVLGSLDVGVTLVDRQARYLHVNAAAAGLLRSSPEALVGATMGSAMPPDAAFQSAFTRALTLLRPESVEDYFAEADCGLSLQIYPSAHGATVVFQELSGEQRARQELERRRWLAALLERLGSALIAGDTVERRLRDSCDVLLDGCELHLLEVVAADGAVLVSLVRPAPAASVAQPPHVREPVTREIDLVVGGRFLGVLRVRGGLDLVDVAAAAGPGFAMLLEVRRGQAPAAGPPVAPGDA